ncbi:MAG: ROK family transcriptional regulator [Clostridia bacterium]
MKYLHDDGGLEKLSSQQLIKEENTKRLFNLLNRGREMSRADLVRMTGLSPTTVSALVDELQQADLVLETGLAPKAHSGRKAINLRIRADGRQIPVFSLNRWGVRFTLYNLAYETLETCFVAHAADQYGGFAQDAPDANPDTGDDYPALMEDILKNRAQRYDPDRAVAICISHPGIYLESEEDFSLSAMHVTFTKAAMLALEARLGVPLFLGNSSMSLAYAEKKHLDRAGQPIDDLIYLNVCEGVGAGIVSGGEIFTGSENTAGEIGHVSIDYNGRRCACGNRGCLEQFVNTDAVLETVKRVAAQRQCTELLDMAQDSYDNITLELIGQAYDAGVAAVVAAIDDIAAMLFAGMYSAVCLTGIKRIVLGGGIEKLGAGFLHKLISFTKQNRRHILMRDVCFTYTLTGFKGDSLGIAEYFIDKGYEITLKGAHRA